VDGVPGDVVECGVYRGGSAAILGAALGQVTERRLWLFDTFEGLPAPSEQDGKLAQSYEGRLAASVEFLREVMGKVGFPWKQLELRKGLFQDTLRQGLPERIALLHIDADWYESTLLALRVLYPRVSFGGVVVIDDFGYWEGARKAFFTFCREEGAEPLLERVGDTQSFWRKGAEHNRGLYQQFRVGVYRPRWQ
jgi:O-methyltransferase